MKKHEGQKQWNLNILRLIGLALAIAACYSIFVIAPISGKIEVAALSASRTTAVAHMRLMGTTKWIPSSTWYNTAKSGRTDDYIKGYLYKGMPYSQNNGGSTKEYWNHFSSKLTCILYPYVDVYNCNVTAGFEFDVPDEFGAVVVIKTKIECMSTY